MAVEKDKKIEESKKATGNKNVDSSQGVQDQSERGPDGYHVFNYGSLVPSRHGPEVEALGSYRAFPCPFPSKSSVIDPVKDSSKSKPISLMEMEKILEKYYTHKRDKALEHTKFNALQDEREYYKSYFPTIEEKKSHLKREVDHLNEQSRHMSEQVGEKEHLKSKLHEDARRLDQTVARNDREAYEIAEMQKHNAMLREKVAMSNADVYHGIVNNSSVQQPLMRQPAPSMAMGNQVLPDNINEMSHHSGMHGSMGNVMHGSGGNMPGSGGALMQPQLSMGGKGNPNQSYLGQSQSHGQYPHGVPSKIEEEVMHQAMGNQNHGGDYGKQSGYSSNMNNHMGNQNHGGDYGRQSGYSSNMGNQNHGGDYGRQSGYNSNDNFGQQSGYNNNPNNYGNQSNYSNNNMNFQKNSNPGMVGNPNWQNQSNYSNQGNVPTPNRNPLLMQFNY